MSKFLSPVFENNSIRVLDQNNQFWFVAQDVCSALNIKNVTQAVDRLDEDERSMFNIGRQGAVNIINESGLYILILRCRDAMKKGSAPYRFRKWVTSEVLPSIRKNGSYTHTINTEQQYQIKEAVMQLARKTGKRHPAIYHDLYNHFKIPRYQDLLAKDFQAALKFLEWSEPKQIQNTNTLLIPFNLVRDATYAVFVRNGKAQKRSIMYAEDARDIGTPWGSSQ